MDEVKRYFLFAFACLMYNLWKFANLFLETKVAFQTFVFVLFSVVKEKVDNGGSPDYIKQLKAMILGDFS